MKLSQRKVPLREHHPKLFRVITSIGSATGIVCESASGCLQKAPIRAREEKNPRPFARIQYCVHGAEVRYVEDEER